MNNSTENNLNINSLNKAPKKEPERFISIMKGVIGVAVIITIFGLLVVIFPLTKTSQHIQTSQVTEESTSGLDILRGSAATADTSIIGLSGTINLIDDNQLTLQLSDGQNAKIQTTSDTEIIREFKISESLASTQKIPIKQSDLEKGSKVEILAKTNGVSLLQGTAQKIVVTY